MTDFNLILTNAKRDDDYVNASALCKHFGKNLDNFLRLKRTKSLMESEVYHTLRSEVVVPGTNYKTRNIFVSNTLTSEGVTGSTYVSPH